jgi:hypothetical protein
MRAGSKFGRTSAPRLPGPSAPISLGQMGSCAFSEVSFDDARDAIDVDAR